MRPKLSGKILFVFSDPGGAKPCLSFIEESNFINAIAISDREHSFYKDFKTSVIILKHGFEQLIDTLKPDLIFTGTSYKSDIEQQFIKIALRNSITCFSFIDHWTSISKRFEDATGKRTLPDQVWVIDEHAQKIAIKEGIDKAKIIISGNPYHDWLKNWKPKMSKKDFIKYIDLQLQNKKILVYAPDPLSNINGMETYGFDEITATKAFVKLFSENYEELRDWFVLVKTHPNQNKFELKKILFDNPSFILMADDVDANSCIYFADVICGFFSSFLIEASVMNKPVLRFFPEKIKKDSIAHLNIGTEVNTNSFISTLKNIKI